MVNYSLINTKFSSLLTNLDKIFHNDISIFRIIN